MIRASLTSKLGMFELMAIRLQTLLRMAPEGISSFE